MRKFYWERGKAAASATVHGWKKELVFSLLFAPASFVATVLIERKVNLTAVWIALVAVVLVWATVFIFNASRSSFLVYQDQETQINVLREFRDNLDEAVTRYRNAQQIRQMAGGQAPAIERLITDFRRQIERTTIDGEPNPDEMALRVRELAGEPYGRVSGVWFRRGGDPVSRPHDGF